MRTAVNTLKTFSKLVKINICFVDFKLSRKLVILLNLQKYRFVIIRYDNDCNLFHCILIIKKLLEYYMSLKKIFQVNYIGPMLACEERINKLIKRSTYWLLRNIYKYEKYLFKNSFSYWVLPRTEFRGFNVTWIFILNWFFCKVCLNHIIKNQK